MIQTMIPYIEVFVHKSIGVNENGMLFIDFIPFDVNLN